MPRWLPGALFGTSIYQTAVQTANSFQEWSQGAILFLFHLGEGQKRILLYHEGQMNKVAWICLLAGTALCTRVAPHKHPRHKASLKPCKR